MNIVQRGTAKSRDEVLARLEALVYAYKGERLNLRERYPQENISELEDRVSDLQTAIKMREQAQRLKAFWGNLWDRCEMMIQPPGEWLEAKAFYTELLRQADEMYRYAIL